MKRIFRLVGAFLAFLLLPFVIVNVWREGYKVLPKNKQIKLFGDGVDLINKKQKRHINFYIPKIEGYYKGKEEIIQSDISNKKLYIMFHGWHNNLDKSFLNVLSEAIIQKHGKGVIVVMVDLENIMNQSWLGNRLKIMKGLQIPPYFESRWSKLIAIETYKVLASNGFLVAKNVEVFGHSLGVLVGASFAKIFKIVDKFWVMNPPGQIFGAYKVGFDGDKILSLHGLANQLIAYSTRDTFFDDNNLLPITADKNYLVLAPEYHVVDKHWIFQETLMRSFKNEVELINIKNGAKENIDEKWWSNNNSLPGFLDISLSKENIKHNAVFYMVNAAGPRVGAMIMLDRRNVLQVFVNVDDFIRSKIDSKFMDKWLEEVNILQNTADDKNR